MSKYRVTVLRHGNAVPATEKTHSADMARALSQKGETQAHERRQKLDRPRYNLQFSSPAVRALHTGHIIGGGFNNIHMYDDLAWTEGTAFAAAIDLMFNQLGYKPLSEYRKHGMGHMLDTRGAEGWSHIRRALDALNPNDIPGLDLGSDLDALITGHAVMINALGCAAIPKGEAAEKILAETSFGECEGYTLTLIDGKFAKLDLHQ